MAAAAAADQQRAAARSGELTASAVAALTVDPSLAKLLALEATTVVDEPTYQSTSVLHRVLAADPIIARYSMAQGRARGDRPRGPRRGRPVDRP